MRGLSRFSRSTRLLAALGLLVSGVFMLLAPAGALTGGGASTATLSRDGWWEPKPSLSTVPANAIAVGAQGGNDTKIAAIGMDIFVADDEELVGLTLTLKEATGPGANFPPITEQSQSQPQSAVVIVACPITSIWVPEDGGDKAVNPPVADCDMARGDGVRNHAAGTWSFDLTFLAELWINDTIDQNGILLIERVGPPMSFQVSFEDLSTGSPALDLDTFPITDEPEDDFTEEEFEEFISGGTDSGSTDDNFFSAIGSTVTGTSDTPFGITDTPPTTAPAQPEAERRNQPVANRRPTKGTLPLGTLALIPLVLGLALLSGVILGPAGDPATVRHREGGLSRALARRTPTPQQ